MSKREHEEEQDSRPAKRPRPTKIVQVDRPVEAIHTARQLQLLLTFQQDDVPQLRHGIASCKAFLENITYHSDDDDQQERLSLLKEYLESEKPRDVNDTDRPFFTQLWQAWSYANSNNSDHLSSAICSLFALLLKSLSTLVDFRDYGRLLCRTVLQFQHLRLIKRCLDAPKHKEFLLSPSLRLLSEVTNFDGGTFAHEVYKRREQTFDGASIRKCLTIVKADDSEDDLKRRPAVRTLAVRYVLTHLRLQDEGGKIDILKQRLLCSTLFSYFRSDPPELLLEILRTVEAQVFKQNDLPRASKAALLTQQHLDRVLDIATRATVNEEVTDVAFKWLMAVCSTPSYGILRSAGWYPPGTTQLDSRSTFDHGAIDLGLESLQFWENKEKYQIKNVVLASWLNTLRPKSDLKERELAIACFKCAPELVHAYFRDNALQMDPKLTNTWIGYASFFYQVTSLATPAHAGNVDSTTYAVLPPQTSIVLDNILPKPLTQKVLVRCLNQNDKLISFFAVRILTTVLEKITNLKRDYKQAEQHSPQSSLWDEALRDLEAACIKGMPTLKEIVFLFRRLPGDEQHMLQREATARLLRLYLTTLPSEDSIDISTALVAALARNGSSAAPSWDDLALEHLIVIAQNSTDMKWFQKQGGLTASPIVTMLQLCLKEGHRSLKRLVSNVLLANDILVKQDDARDVSPMLDALLWSLEANQDTHVWEFLEQCLFRATKTPVKYLDDIDSLGVHEGSGQSGLLPAVILEQAPFVVSKDEKAILMRWVNSLLTYWQQVSHSNLILRTIREKIVGLPGWNAKDGSKVKSRIAEDDSPLVNGHTESAPPDYRDKLSLFSLPPTETPDHPELFRWQKKDLDLAIEDHDLDGLILCLCSQYGEVRRQARTQLESFMVKLQGSDLDDKDQLYLLIGELLETYNHGHSEDDTPLPYLVGTFAVHALAVQADPTHHIYPKLNRYLLKSPEWQVNRITSYWLAVCSASMPSDDDGYWKETQWVLEWLVDGVRSRADLEIMRKAGSIERLMALYASPGSSDKLVKQRILEILYRAATVEPLTLVTRAGVLSWLESLRDDVAPALRRFILEQSSSEKLQAWTGCESPQMV